MTGGFWMVRESNIPRVKPDQSHIDKRILGEKGLQYEDSTRTTFVRLVKIDFYGL